MLGHLSSKEFKLSACFNSMNVKAYLGMKAILQEWLMSLLFDDYRFDWSLVWNLVAKSHSSISTKYPNGDKPVTELLVLALLAGGVVVSGLIAELLVSLSRANGDPGFTRIP